MKKMLSPQKAEAPSWEVGKCLVGGDLKWEWKAFWGECGGEDGMAFPPTPNVVLRPALMGISSCLWILSSLKGGHVTPHVPSLSKGVRIHLIPVTPVGRCSL